MSKALLSVAALLLGAGILLVGNGLQSILLPVRAALEGFSTSAIGYIGAAYPLGFVIACWTAPYIVKRVGHIRSFAVLAAIAASVVLLYVLNVQPLSWVLLRIVSGYCFAGLFMVIESWLNEASSNANRGQIFSAYMVVNLCTVTAGQMMLPLGNPATFELFSVAAIAITLGLVPVGLTTSAAPHPIARVQLRLGRLYGMSPVGVLGCFFVGMANGAFGSLGPVFADGAGLSTTGIALFMSAALIGGALGQVPLGRLSDRIDRRKVIVLACLLAIAIGVLLLLAGDARAGGRLFALSVPFAELPMGALIGLVTLYGAAIYPLYALCIAHTNDFVGGEDFVEASSGLLLTWGAGATVGPIIAAYLMEEVGLGGLFLYTGAAHAVFCVLALYRMRQRAPLPAEERANYVLTTEHAQSTQAGVALDPRAPDQPEAPGAAPAAAAGR
jgi:MFS family permease